MKKLILLVMLISGVAKAQTFDFSCVPGTISISSPYSEYLSTRSFSGTFIVSITTTLDTDDYQFYVGQRQLIRDNWNEWGYRLIDLDNDLYLGGGGSQDFELEHKIIAINKTDNSTVESNVYSLTTTRNTFDELLLFEYTTENGIISYTISMEDLPSYIAPLNRNWIRNFQISVEEMRPIVGWVGLPRSYVYNVDVNEYSGTYEIVCDNCSGERQYRIRFQGWSPFWESDTTEFNINWN